MAHSEELKSTAIALFEAQRVHTSDDVAARRSAGIIQDTYKQKVNSRSIKRWAAGENINADIVRNVKDKKKLLADVFEDIAHRLLGAVTDDKLKTAYPDRLVKAAKDAAETMQLLRGAPTSIEGQSGSLWEHINSVSKNGK